MRKLLLFALLVLLSCTSVLKAANKQEEYDVFEKAFFVDSKNDTLLYRILYPENFDKNKSYPLILFLHGAGERGDDNTKQLLWAKEVFLKEESRKQYPSIVVLPQCPEKDFWVDMDFFKTIQSKKGLYEKSLPSLTQSMRLVTHLMDSLVTLPFVDKSKMCITGMSMGGYGTYDFITRNPGMFSKAIPICGGGNLLLARNFSNTVQVKIFHGGNDNIVPCDLSRIMFDRLKSLNAVVDYVEYPGVDHNSWSKAYSEPGIMKWMVSPNNNRSNYITKTDISYLLSKTDDSYKNERCRLDIYYPANKNNFKTIVWFHGGGLEGGGKFIPSELKDKNLCVVAVNYRLSPKVTSPAYIEDGAEAIAWVFKNIEQFGGDPKKIYVSGHSAGGYLTLMLGLKKKYLMHYGIDADELAGLIPLSGQTNTHYTIRKERKLNTLIPLIDEMAPLNCARENIPPILLITGDREKEMMARYEENAHLEVILKALNNKDVTLYELSGFDHGSMLSPGLLLLKEWVDKH